jgi:hypothetical protein
MVHMFRIKGFSGFLMLIGFVCVAFTLLFAFPSAFMMALWNATIFELLAGPEISLGQGAILWAIVVTGSVVLFKPHISIEFKASPEEPNTNNLGDK